MQGRKQFQEKLFTSFQLSDRVPPDNFYRKLKSILDLNFVYKATAKYYGTEGQESIDPLVFFKLMLVGYLENLASDRRIINTCSMRLDILYFIGYDIDEQLPWHSTLSRTRQLYGEDIFSELFKAILKQCIEKGMVSGRRQAVDSVLVKANASMDSIAEKEILLDAETYTKELKLNEDQSIQLVDAYKKKKVEEHHRWKEKAYKGQPGSRAKSKEGDRVDHEGETKRGKFLSNHTHYSTTDADARIAVKPGKPRQFNYLGQVSVDTSHHVITHIHADYADKKDSQCLNKVITGLQQNLVAEGLMVEELVADTGYSSGEALKALEKNNIKGYIPNFGQYKPDRPGFTYHKDGDYYTCPNGAQLPFKKTKNNNGFPVKEYRSSRKDCTPCPLRTSCLSKAVFEKLLRDTPDKAYYDRMHERLKTRYARSMKKIRQSTVEPVLGTLVNFLAMKRLNTRGIKQARKCMIMAAIAYNLKKMLKFRSGKAIPMAGALPNTLTHFYYLLTDQFYFLRMMSRN